MVRDRRGNEDADELRRENESLRRELETARRDAARFRAMIEKSHDGFSLLSADVRTLYQNPPADRLFGYSTEQAAAVAWNDFVDPASIPVLQQKLGELLATPSGTISAEFWMRHKDGSMRWVELTATNLLGDPDVGALVANFRDGTERKRSETKLLQTQDELRQAQKMEAIGRLAGGVAHDFNNLLSVVLSCSAMVLERLEGDHPDRADLQEIVAAGERAANLTQQLLAFSRKQILQPRVLDLNVLVRGVEKMLRRVLGEDIELTFAPGEVGRVFADPGQLEQVLMNLAVNARDAMPLGGNLSLSTSDVVLDEPRAGDRSNLRPGRYVRLAVTDTGKGMDAATRERIFEPFFTTKASKGTGLGLSTVLGIVEQSGGHIAVTSELDVGTRFEVLFPVAEPLLDERASPAPARDVRGGGEAILVVEDDAAVRAAIRSILSRQGYRVSEAPNGIEAIELAETLPSLDLIVSDVVMPHMSGREVAERIGSKRAGVRVLFMSGYAEDSIVHHGILDRGIAFLQKPITPEALLHKVRDVLDRRR